MAEMKFCQQCNQEQKCREVYRRLGKDGGPSIALKAVVAFLLPLLIFVVSLAALEGILVRITSIEQMRAIVEFLLALLVTFAAVLIIKVINKYLNKSR